MKLLLDQGLPRTAAELLRTAGLDALHTGEVGLAEATDAEIIAYCAQQGRVIATLDADFHALLAVSGAAEPSVIRLRIEGLRAEALAGLLQHVAAEFAAELDSGALLSVQERSVRIRLLPIGSREP